MSEYEIWLSDQAEEFLKLADEKSTRIISEKLSYLAENPYPGRGQGDKASETINGEECYRIHLSRTHTAIYVIDEDKSEVGVDRITTIGAAHKLYD